MGEEMIDWTYGVLEASVGCKNQVIKWKNNPIYLDDVGIPLKGGLIFNIIGQGKITQVSFASDSKDALLGLQIDSQEPAKINNGYCLSNLCDTRGIGTTQIQRVQIDEDMVWRYTFLIPMIFDEKIKILIMNEGHNDKEINVSNIHIYYLVPKVIRI